MMCILLGLVFLEVACGKRPTEVQAAPEDLILVDWVFSCWNRDEIIGAIDPNLGTDYVVEEAELVLTLGLMCSNSVPVTRTNMQRVVQYLEGYERLPEISSLGISVPGLTYAHHQGFDNFGMPYPSFIENTFSHSSYMAESVLSGGR